MIGDALASGARSATFAVAPKLKFDPEEMKRDLKALNQEEFCDKYLVAKPEYEMLKAGGESVNNFARQMEIEREAFERVAAIDAKREASLQRECFLELIVGYSGRVLVARDKPETAQQTSRLLIPRSMRKQKEMLPTTGHIIQAVIMDTTNQSNAAEKFVGRRVVFSPMSGTPLCFNGYPTWHVLEASELIAFINKTDAEIVEEPLEPMV
jgi:hypothetical protein